MSFKAILVVIIVLSLGVLFWLIALTATTISTDQAKMIADSCANELEWKLHGEIHKLSYDQQLYREELDELKSALNEQGIATGYTTEKKLYYKDKKDERTNM